MGQHKPENRRWECGHNPQWHELFKEFARGHGMEEIVRSTQMAILIMVIPITVYVIIK